jgi:hypothetical protein
MNNFYETPVVHLTLFDVFPCMCATHRKEGYVLRKVKRVGVMVWAMEYKINEDKPLGIYFFHRRRPVEGRVTFKGMYI